MFKTIGTILNAISSLTNSIVGITTSIDNVIESTNAATSAIRIHAEELEAVASFDVQKKAADRKKAMAKYEEELANL